MPDCLFCKIAKKQLSAEIIEEDNDFMVFKDINPKAKLHLLLIPKLHITSLAHLEPEHQTLLGKALSKLNSIATANGAPTGFRTIINTGRDGGQEVDHLHIHLLAGNLPKFG